MMNLMEEIILEFDSSDLERWKRRDPALVPEYFLNHKGPGIEQGYHFGECFVWKKLIGDGNDVIFPECFNIIDRNSKFDENNHMIAKAMGRKKYGQFRIIAESIRKAGMKIENPDICVISPLLFFADVKRGNDKMREPQKIFALICSLLDIPFKVYKLVPKRQDSG